MSQENVEIVRRGYERFQATENSRTEIVAPADSVRDVSKFGGAVDQQVSGRHRSHSKRRSKTGTTPWIIERSRLTGSHDAGERSRARSSTSAANRGRLACSVRDGLAQVWTVRDGMETRMEMYADPAEALEAVGLAE